jgi:hypothetical protein
VSVKSFKVDNGASASDIQVAAAPGINQVVRVLNYVLVANGTVTVQFASGTAGGGGQTNLTGAMQLATGTPLQPGFCGDDFSGRSTHFDTNVGEGLVLKFGGGTQVSGYVNYILAPQG